ncbi:neuronal acetylcholine receptor subunit alpha-9-like isoform X2 [Ptychodera flava]|uniref:neuronal acetylcholine receptor subunit alpha-9-like isoform X2 n=1 Tax=Ptychodera flava TaxID=63121 RepID=UPI00396A90B4
MYVFGEWSRRSKLLCLTLLHFQILVTDLVDCSLANSTSDITAANDTVDYRFFLHSHLFQEYKTQVLPVLRRKSVVNVSFGFSLNQVIDVAEKSQMVTYSIWLRQRWFDERLTWNIEEFDGIEEIVLPADDVWRPEMEIYNGVGDERATDPASTHVRLRYDGLIKWHYPTIITTNCKMDVKNFPFDRQCCPIKVGPWMWDGRDVDIQAELDSGAALRNLETKDVWDVESVPVKYYVHYYECCPGVPYPSLLFMVHLHRRSEPYVLCFVIPSVCICVMAIAGFFLPPVAGERIGLSITTLLTMFVFYQLVNEEIPPTADLPNFALYISLNIMVMVLSSIATIITLNVHHMGSRRTVPGWLNKMKKMYVSYVNNCCKTKDQRNMKEENRDEMSTIRGAMTDSDPEVHFCTELLDSHRSTDYCASGTYSGAASTGNNNSGRELKTMTGTRLGGSRREMPSREIYEEDPKVVRQWHEISLVLDRFFFILFLVWFALITIIYICLVLVHDFVPHCVFPGNDTDFL